MTISQPERIQVPVEGGELAAGVWRNPGASGTVVAVHGITANYSAWLEFEAAARPGLLVAPDLRGRGYSAQLPGPFTLVDHARDVVDLIERLDLADRDDLVLVGHSMGAFVQVLTVTELVRRGHRAPAVVLVDGGLPLPGVSGSGEQAEIQLAPVLARLRTTFPSREAVYDFWRGHPSFRDAWSEAVRAYADHDITGEEPELRARPSVDAVSVNALELPGSEAYGAAVTALADAPVVFLRAPRDLIDQPPGLYPPELRDAWRPRLPGWRFVEVDDTNHYTILMTPRGARAVADAVSSAKRP